MFGRNSLKPDHYSSVVWYIFCHHVLMSSASRAARLSGIRRSVTARTRPRIPMLRVARPSSGLDLAATLRAFPSELRSRAERSDALIDIVRSVNTTLEPRKIAELIV